MKHLRTSVLLFILLAVATAMGLSGASLDPASMKDRGGDVAEVPPTTEAVPPGEDGPALTPDVTEAASEPTPASTDAPAETPTPTTPADPTATAEESGPVETPRPQVPENTTGASIIVERGVSDRNLVALTFDAGEGPGYAEEILDFLAAEGIHASFGLTGDWVRAHPETVQRMVEEGHMIFNHSDTHQSWTGASTTGVPLTEDERIDELMGAAVAIEEATGGYETAPFWRPPYGDYDAEGQQLLADYGYDYTLYWTCDSLAWTGTTPEEIAEKCGPDQPGGGPGAIILMHVTQEADYLSLEALVAEYEAAGYEFVTMEEMIAD